MHEHRPGADPNGDPKVCSSTPGWARATCNAAAEARAEFTVADLTGRGLALWATGQRPHYGVVYGGNDLESLIERLAAVPHRIRDNPSVDREEH